MRVLVFKEKAMQLRQERFQVVEGVWSEVVLP